MLNDIGVLLRFLFKAVQCQLFFTMPRLGYAKLTYTLICSWGDMLKMHSMTNHVSSSVTSEGAQCCYFQ